MKKFLSILVMCVMASVNAFAQELVVTLTHGDTTTEYYGISAFQTAVNASVNGDLITLSPGVFHGGTIENRSITLRGNGSEGENATIFDTDVVVKKPAIENDPGLNIQGFKIDAKLRFATPLVSENINVSKCKITSIECDTYYGWSDSFGRTRNLNILQCEVIDHAYFQIESEANFVNSVVANFYYNRYDQNNNFNFINCVVYATDHSSYYDSSSYNKKLNFSARNSIFITNTDQNNFFVNTPNFDHCIVTGALEEMPNLLSKCSLTATQYMPITSVFKTLTDNTIYTEDTFELTDAAAAVVGTDGNQLGIYGGYLPYDMTVTYPHFTTFNVAEKAENGQLDVELQIND